MRPRAQSLLLPHAIAVYSFITPTMLWPFLLRGPLLLRLFGSYIMPLCCSLSVEGQGRAGAGQVTVWSSCLSLCCRSPGRLLIFNIECCPLPFVWTLCTACWAVTVVQASHLTYYSSIRLAVMCSCRATYWMGFVDEFHINVLFSP